MSIDHTSFSSDGPSTSKITDRWWQATEAELPKSVDAVITTLQQVQNKIDSQRAISARLYGNSPAWGLTGFSSNKLGTSPLLKDRITYNLIQSVTDTVTAKIAKNRPKPLFLTKRGDYKKQRKAQKLNQFMDGVFFDNQVRVNSPVVFRDGCVIGTGITHVFSYYGQVKYERVMASELVVDELEALYGYPRQLHRVKNVDRQVLADLFPSKKKSIMVTNSATDNQTVTRPHVSDQVTVMESWHLPSGPEAKDGLHTICISDGVLLKEPYDRQKFPFAFFHWSRPMYGFWGQSLAEQLQPIQLEINKLLWVIQRSMHLMGTSKIWLEQGSKIVKEYMGSDIGAIGTYTGTPPMYLTPPMVQQELYAHLSTLIQRGYEQSGISMLSATAQKPAGLDSGKAMREYNDIESERFMIVGQAYEQYHLDLAELSVQTARDIYSKDKKFSARVPGRKFIETIDWKDVDMEEDQYVMQVFPISSLPSDPEGRLATIQEYIQAGFVDQRQGRRLLDQPDLDQTESLANSIEERILSALDKIVDEGIYTPPDQYMEPNLGRELALQYYNQYANQGLEDERLLLLDQFITQLDDLETMAQPPMPTAPVGGEQALSPGLTLPEPPAPQPLM